MPSRYRLLGRIEAGELAELHAATGGEQQDVVIRLFHPRTTDAAYAREIADVARVLRSVSDEGIVGYLDVGMVHGRLAVVRPRVEGFSLGDALPRLIGRELLLPAPIALTLIVQLLETLELAHRAGAVHGAITPGNVLVLSQGRLALQDFGALRALQAAPALDKEFAGRGRDAYRAPELARGEPPTIQSDIYSVGIIAYELLTFRQPAGGGFSTRREAVLPPSRLDRRLNVRIDPIVMRAIDPAPQRRFHSCADFAAGLRSFLANTGGMPLKEDLVRFAAEAMPRSPQPLGPPAFAEPFTLEPVGDSGPPAPTEDQIAPSAVLVPVPARVNPAAMAFDDRTEAVVPDEGLTTELDRQPGAMAFDERTSEATPPDEVLTTAPGRQPEAMTFDERTSEAMPPDEVLTTAPGRPDLGDGASAATTDPENPKPEASAPAVPAGGAEWVAPPGTLPRPRRHPQASSATLGAAPRRATRLKLIEDFQGTAAPEPASPAGLVSGEPLEEQGPRAHRRENPPPPQPAQSSPPAEATAARTDPQVTPLAPSDAPVSTGTVERDFYGHARRRRRMVLVAVGIAAVGAVSFVVGLRRSDQEGSLAGSPDAPSEAEAAVQPPNEDPAYRTVDGAMKKYLQAHEEKATAAPPPPATPPASPAGGTGGGAGEAEAGDRYDAPPPKRTAGFLTVVSNIPANVFIDGLKVRKRTPLVRYPVQPGSRKIVLEAVSTLERRELTLTFRRGQMRRVDEKFQRVR